MEEMLRGLYDSHILFSFFFFIYLFNKFQLLSMSKIIYLDKVRFGGFVSSQYLKMVVQLGYCPGGLEDRQGSSPVAYYVSSNPLCSFSHYVL